MTTATISENVSRYIDSIERSRSASQTDDHERDIPPRSMEPMTPREATLVGLVELLLKDQQRLDDIAREPAAQRELIPRLLGVGVGGYAIFAAALAIIFNCARVWPSLTPLAHWLENRNETLLRFVPLTAGGPIATLLDGSALSLIVAFVFGLVGAIGVCLPSFYFYGLLSGVRATMLQVTTIALKGLAAGAVAVLGALPIYLAFILGLVIFNLPERAVSAAGVLGLALPFITGAYGTRALYRGFVSLAETLPAHCRDQRTCFLRRLLLAWSACYTAVTPVMIFTIWERLSRLQ